MARPRTVRLKPHKLHVHICRTDEHIRLWRSDNPGDVFDVVSFEEFETVKKFQSLPLIEGFPENDAGDLECTLCIHNQTEEV